ncbi:hypothetical protein SOCE836_076710 [Sorangium cellulosum]|uniref:Uncharacterized protein n=1 Tax=Sorangium cellulosum TaxID=56 RepID=A0A4P2QY56_SORCE|nr:hypothetical protein SOCE836_076710 [Sorangium cellulosum]WCQ94783.1 hypothetical protein NQZ70_07552 [Sorangium sp. Soce836]
MLYIGAVPIPVSTPPFPFDAVRDLLGVVRAIYAAAKDGGASREELARIARVGRELSRALDLAGSPQQGVSGHSAAWKVTDKAMLQVNDLVDPLTPAAPLLLAARSRVTGSRLAMRSKPQGR